MKKEYRIEVTRLAVTCWVFALLGDLATIYAVANRPDLVLTLVAVFSSVTLAFLGFRNVRQYSVGTNPGGWTNWHLWIELGLFHMWGIGQPIGIAGLMSLWGNITQKWPDKIPQMKTEVGLLSIGVVFAVYVVVLVWRLGLLDKPEVDRCHACSTPAMRGANYCDQCGIKLNRCVHCGRIHNPTARYCPKSGKYLGAP